MVRAGKLAPAGDLQRKMLPNSLHLPHIKLVNRLLMKFFLINEKKSRVYREIILQFDDNRHLFNYIDYFTF